MARFVLRRILWAIPVLLLAVTMIFFLMRAIGGNPFRHGPLLGLSAPGDRWVKYGDPQPQAIEDNLARRYGLDLPWYLQYVHFVARRGLTSPARVRWPATARASSSTRRR